MSRIDTVVDLCQCCFAHTGSVSHKFLAFRLPVASCPRSCVAHQHASHDGRHDCLLSTFTSVPANVDIEDNVEKESPGACDAGGDDKREDAEKTQEKKIELALRDGRPYRFNVGVLARGRQTK